MRNNSLLRVREEYIILLQSLPSSSFLSLQQFPFLFPVS